MNHVRAKLCCWVAGFALIALAFAGSAAASKRAPNTGKAGSPCAPQNIAAKPTSADAGLDTTGLGAAAPAGYTMGGPTNRPDSGQPVKRVMMLLHSGGWYMVGKGALDANQPEANTWRGAGWEAVNVDYLACGRSLHSAVKMYDLVRAHFGPDVPICISGESAGGQLALMIAAHRKDVACVIAVAAPTDLKRIARQGQHAAAAGLAPMLLAKGAATVAGIAKAAFGLLGLNRVSPLQKAAEIHSRVLLASASDDPMIPVAQTASMARALTKANPGSYVDTLILDPGTQLFGHGTASAAAISTFGQHVADLVAPFGKAPVSG